jgi:hypothetical protein
MAGHSPAAPRPSLVTLGIQLGAQKRSCGAGVTRTHDLIDWRRLSYHWGTFCFVIYWSVPSSEVNKCDTNTSPRRLVTHLLQQMDQSFTSRRHRGHGSANATRNNTNANDHTTIAKAFEASSEYDTMEALCGGPGYTGTVGCRAATYSTSSGTKSGSSSEKQLVKQGWAHMYLTSSTPPTEGLISRSCTWYI